MSDAPPPPPEKLTLAPELIQARERLGLTQAQLASSSGLSLAAIKGYETGRTLPGARELRQLCATLKITPNKLLFGVDAPFTSGVDRDSEIFTGPYWPAVLRQRIAVLSNLLTADECASFYSLMSALVLNRHGAEHLGAAERAADMAAGIDVMSEGGPFIADLFRAITRDKAVAQQVADALRRAADEAEGKTGPKVSKD